MKLCEHYSLEIQVQVIQQMLNKMQPKLTNVFMNEVQYHCKTCRLVYKISSLKVQKVSLRVQKRLKRLWAAKRKVQPETGTPFLLYPPSAPSQKFCGSITLRGYTKIGVNLNACHFYFNRSNIAAQWEGSMSYMNPQTNLKPISAP